VEDFARYHYLPRLVGPEVLIQAIRDGIALLTFKSDTFAYAESYDEAASRFRGLRGGQVVNVSSDSVGLLVKPDVAQRQLDAETQPPKVPGEGAAGGDAGGDGATIPGIAGAEAGVAGATPAGGRALLRRYHGTVTLDPERVGRDASRIADEVIAHLNGLVGAEVCVTLEIEAKIPTGASDQVVRTVTENSRTLKFLSQGFEKD